MNDVQLKGALQACSLHALLMVVSKALARSGYGDVLFLDRRRNKDKSRYGGHELVCESKIGNRLHRVVVKVVRDSARIRHLDELAGTVLRMNADSGLLITPFHITKNARQQIEKYNPIRTTVIDGTTLAAWLMELSIGVRNGSEVDFAYFGGLEEISNRVLSFLAAMPT